MRFSFVEWIATTAGPRAARRCSAYPSSYDTPIAGISQNRPICAAPVSGRPPGRPRIQMKPTAPASSARPSFSVRCMRVARDRGVTVVAITIAPFIASRISANVCGSPAPTSTSGPSTSPGGQYGSAMQLTARSTGRRTIKLVSRRTHPGHVNGSSVALSAPNPANRSRMNSAAGRSCGLPRNRGPNRSTTGDVAASAARVSGGGATRTSGSGCCTEAIATFE